MRALSAFLGGFVLVGAWAAPAQADESTCDTKSGTYLDGKLISMCLSTVTYYDDNSNRAFYTKSTVVFGPKATSATGCKITLYATLDKAGSNSWNSSKVTKSCDDALEHRGTNALNYHNYSSTSGTVVRATGCIDLYYNHSSSSGWQWCSTSAWDDWS